MSICETIQKLEERHGVEIEHEQVDQWHDKFTIVRGRYVFGKIVYVEELPRLETILETAINKLQKHLDRL